MNKEELTKKTVEELSDMILELTETKEMYYNLYNEASEKFNRYKDAVKSVVLFID
jgi:hypothetical protein